MVKPLHTIVETPDYLSDAKRAGMTDADRENAIQTFAKQPDAGDELVGSGGVRKVRLAGRGKGKSGGFRVVAAFVAVDIPVYFLGVLSKGDRENFTDREIQAFKTFTDAIKAVYRSRRKR